MKNDLTQNPKSKKSYSITDNQDSLTGQRREPRKQSQKKRKLAAAIAAVLAITAMAAITLQPYAKQKATATTQQSRAKQAAASVVKKAAYPKMAPYPDEAAYTNEDGTFDHKGFSKAYDAWFENVLARYSLSGYEAGLEGFLRQGTKEFLSASSTENLVYSPLNVYMALAMLAELTNGNSRAQILDLLGSPDIKALRKQASDLWNANYCNDGAVTSILASSLWLNENVSFKKAAMDRLAKTYYASSYKGTMGSDAFNKLLQDWLNEQTGGLLKEQTAGEKLAPDTILALATAVYFRAKWYSEFAPAWTADKTFHGADGDTLCSFMHKDKSTETYYWGKQFSAVSQSLEQSGSMWFLLPKEGVSVDKLLGDSEAMGFLLSPTSRSEWKSQKNMLVNLAVPKFDVSSKIKLADGLKALGVTDVFNDKTADFSPMAKNTDGVYLSKVNHAARVAIDEQGVTAAAYTVMALSGGGMPLAKEEIDFVLDRPFLFAITGEDGLPLFVGVVNRLS